MTLLDVIEKIDSFNEEDTICAARPWTVHSEAVVGPGQEDGALVGFQRMYGKDYFLEVSIARDFVFDWKAAHGTNDPMMAIGERLIQYAENDA